MRLQPMEAIFCVIRHAHQELYIYSFWPTEPVPPNDMEARARVYCAGLRIEGLECKVQGLGFSVLG